MICSLTNSHKNGTLRKLSYVFCTVLGRCCSVHQHSQSLHRLRFASCRVVELVVHRTGAGCCWNPATRGRIAVIYCCLTSPKTAVLCFFVFSVPLTCYCLTVKNCRELRSTEKLDLLHNVHIPSSNDSDRLAVQIIDMSSSFL
jgi:hypothetical protein